MTLFDSEIEEKRQILKNILHKIYANMVGKRRMIRNLATKFLLRIKNEGTAEILDFFASIIKGFVMPLNDEKLSFFLDVLVPLHNKPNIELYFDRLVKCCLIYIQKEETLSVPLIKAILLYFNKSNPHKDKLFVNELLDVFKSSRVDKYSCFFKTLIPILLELVTYGLASEALQPLIIKLFSVCSFLGVIEFYKRACLPVIIPIFSRLSMDSKEETKNITLIDFINRNKFEIMSKTNCIVSSVDRTMYKEIINNLPK